MTAPEISLTQLTALLELLRARLAPPAPLAGGDGQAPETKANPCPAQPAGGPAQAPETKTNPCPAQPAGALDEKKREPAPSAPAGGASAEKKAEQGAEAGKGSHPAQPAGAPDEKKAEPRPDGKKAGGVAPELTANPESIDILARSLVFGDLGVGARAPEAEYLVLIARLHLTEVAKRLLPRLRLAGSELHRSAERCAAELRP